MLITYLYYTGDAVAGVLAGVCLGSAPSRLCGWPIRADLRFPSEYERIKGFPCSPNVFIIDINSSALISARSFFVVSKYLRMFESSDSVNKSEGLARNDLELCTFLIENIIAIGSWRVIAWYATVVEKSSLQQMFASEEFRVMPYGFCPLGCRSALDLLY